MDCFEAKELAGEYINRSLPSQKMEEFIAHVRSCPSCYDELETYFIVDEALNQLSEEGETELDFKKLLDQDLKRSERRLVFERLKLTVVILGVFLLGVAAVYLIYALFMS